jgi:hypothetical protein
MNGFEQVGNSWAHLIGRKGNQDEMIHELYGRVFERLDAIYKLVAKYDGQTIPTVSSDLKNALLVKACNNDPVQIDLVLNNCLSPNTNKVKYKKFGTECNAYSNYA